MEQCHSQGIEIAQPGVADTGRVERLGRQIAPGAAAGGLLAGIVLAAGQSTRMGAENKLLQPLRGKPILRHAVEAQIEAGLSPVIVVTGHQRAEVEAWLRIGEQAPRVVAVERGPRELVMVRDDASIPTLRSLVREAVGTVEDPGAMAGGLGLLADVLVRRGRCPPVGKISDARAINGQTRLVKFQPLYSQVKTTDSGVTLEFASLSINADSDHGAALRFVSASTEPFHVGDLPGLPGEQLDQGRPDVPAPQQTDTHALAHPDDRSGDAAPPPLRHITLT